MFGLFKNNTKKQQGCRRHTWRLIAFDQGYVTNFGDSNKIHHHVRFEECEQCSERRAVVDKNKPKFDQERWVRHRTLNMAIMRWEECGDLQITDMSDIYSDEYVPVTPNHKPIMRLKKQHVSGVERLLQAVQDDEEFVKLSENPMVKDAFDELLTVVKLHQNN